MSALVSPYLYSRHDDLEPVGQVLAALDRHGLADNTLVVFFSDNGGERFSRNAPFAKGKAQLWEGGIRVPCIIRWPSVVPSGKTTTQPAITMDISATILAATQTTPPAGRTLDGENLLPVLCGERPVHDRTFFWRSKTQIAARKGRWKYIRDPKGEYLYDLTNDLGETTNLAAKHPDLVREMKEVIKNWEADVKEYQWAPGSRWEKTPP